MTEIEYFQNMDEYLKKTDERIKKYGENTISEYAYKMRGLDTAWNRDFDQFPLELLSEKDRAGYLHAKENLSMGYIASGLAAITLEKYATKKQKSTVGDEYYIIAIQSDDPFIQELYTCYKRSLEHAAYHMGEADVNDPDWPRWE
jgi:hypothetical protein